MMKKFAIVSAVLAMSAAAFADDFPFPGLPAAIPDNVPAGITRDVVVGTSFPITGVELVLTMNPEHTWVGDLIVRITKVAGAGTGATTDVMNRVGAVTSGAVGNDADLGGTYTFGDNPGYGNIWAFNGSGVNIPVGNYRGTSALSSTPISMTAPFLGLDSAGTYRLFISDNAGLDTGTLTAATLRLVPEPATLSLLALGALTLIRRR